MKRTLFLLLAICGFTFALTGCSSENSPKGVVELFLHAMQKGDGEKMFDLVYMDEELASLNCAGKEAYKKEYPKEYRDRVKDLREVLNEGRTDELQQTTFKIVSEKIDGNEALVVVEMTRDEKSKSGEVRVMKDKDGKWNVDIYSIYSLEF